MNRINKVITKREAIDIVRNKYINKMSNFTELYISVDSVRVKDIVDYMDERIFKDLDSNISGWMAFFDPAVFMNWEHPCEYLFIVTKEDYEFKMHMRAPNDTINVEVIK